MLSWDHKMIELSRIFREMAKATRLTGWASDVGKDESSLVGADLTRPSDIAGRQIDAATWAKAFFTAMALAKVCPRLDVPEVGANPDGFVTLTWVDGGNRILDLQLRPDGYRWCQQGPTDKRTIQSDSLQDVAESMRATFDRAV